MLSTISRQEFDNFKKNGFNRIPLVLECFADLDTPLSVYSKLANDRYSYLLESADGGNKYGRYSIIGLPAKVRIQIKKDKILIFKAGILQQYDSPVSMYCNPINCYCAKILGDLNQVTINNKTFYLRPEKIKLSKTSRFNGVVEKSQFAGKEYKISVSINGEICVFFNDFPLEKNEKIKLEFQNKDLIEFEFFFKPDNFTKLDIDHAHIGGRVVVDDNDNFFLAVAVGN